MNLKVRRASLSDTKAVSLLVMELLQEIMEKTGEASFHVEIAAFEDRLREWFVHDSYMAFLAFYESSVQPIGVITLCEAQALYTGGVFGTIPEFYVLPTHRSLGVGRRLLDVALQFGKEKGWNRLEVTTPPLPFFESTLNFYEREQFVISGGRKMRRLLTP